MNRDREYGHIIQSVENYGPTLRKEHSFYDILNGCNTNRIDPVVEEALRIKEREEFRKLVEALGSFPPGEPKSEEQPKAKSIRLKKDKPIPIWKRMKLIEEGAF